MIAKDHIYTNYFTLYNFNNKSKIVNKTINNFISCENDLLLFDIKFPDSLRLHLSELTKQHYTEVLAHKGSSQQPPVQLVVWY